jgi:hypothetical protein
MHAAPRSFRPGGDFDGTPPLPCQWPLRTVRTWGFSGPANLELSPRGHRDQVAVSSQVLDLLPAGNAAAMRLLDALTGIERVTSSTTSALMISAAFHRCGRAVAISAQAKAWAWAWCIFRLPPQRFQLTRQCGFGDNHKPVSLIPVRPLRPADRSPAHSALRQRTGSPRGPGRCASPGLDESPGLPAIFREDRDVWRTRRALRG